MKVFSKNSHQKVHPNFAQTQNLGRQFLGNSFSGPKVGSHSKDVVGAGDGQPRYHVIGDEKEELGKHKSRVETTLSNLTTESGKVSNRFRSQSGSLSAN